MHLIVGVLTENGTAKWEFAGGWGNEKDFCQDYPIFVWLSRKHEAVSGREVVIAGVQFLFTFSLGVCTRVCVPIDEFVLLLWKAVVFSTLIEIISIRIEPSQRTSMLYAYPCMSFNSSSLSAFTSVALWTTESISLAAKWKNESKCSCLSLHMKQINGWLSNWHFVREDSAITIIAVHSLLWRGNALCIKW